MNNNKMLDKIALIHAHERRSEWADAQDFHAADAIIAALPDMIAPLVWESCGGSHKVESVVGTYRIEVGPNQLETGKPLIGWAHNDEYAYHHGELADTLEAAKAAANAHHRASIMEAFK